MDNSTNTAKDSSIDTGTILSGGTANNTSVQQNNEKDSKDDEISLIDLLAVLLKYKRMIIVVTVLAALFAVTYSIFSLKLPSEKSPLPNQYTPKALMLINNSTSSSSTAASLLASSGLSSLSGMAGVSLGGSSYSSLAVYLSGTDSFLDTVVDKFDLITKWKIKKAVRSTSRKMLKKNLKAEYDSDSGVFSISFTDTDPTFACDVVNFAVDYMDNRFTELGVDKNKIQKENLEKNIDACLKELQRLQKESHNLEVEAEGGSSNNIPSIVMETTRITMEIKSQESVYTQLKTQYEVLKVQMQSETPVFQILEKATVPDQKSGPSRGKLCIIITFAAFFIAIFLAFLLNAIENIRKDPEAMRKLHVKSHNSKHIGSFVVVFIVASLFTLKPLTVTAQSSNTQNKLLNSAYGITETDVKNAQLAKSNASTNNDDSKNSNTSATEDFIPSAQIAMSVAEYEVTAGDVYSLNYAAGSTPVSFSIFVDRSYKIPVSNLATLNCAGMTYLQLKTQVEAIVRKNYPLSGVQFMLLTPAQYKVVITGEVKQTIEKTAWPLSRLSTLIGDSLTDYSSIRNVTVTSSSGKKETYDLFKAKRDGKLTDDPYIRPGDIISLNRISRVVTITGEVERPGTYELLKGENLKTLVSYYGNGLTDFADLSRMELVRTNASNDSTISETNIINKIYLPNNAVESDYELHNNDNVQIATVLDIQPVLFIEGAIYSTVSTAPEASSKIAINFKKGDNLASIVRQYKNMFNAVSDTSNAYIIRGDKTIKENLDRILYDNTYYSSTNLENGDILMIPFRQYFITVSGAVKTPGRYPYIPDRDWQYYIGLAGGVVSSENVGDSIRITDVSGKEHPKTDPITPETDIYAKSNSFLYFFNQYSGPVTTILTLISTTIIILANIGLLK